MRISSLIDTLVFTSCCWESCTSRIRQIVLSLKNRTPVTFIEPPVLGYTTFASLIESWPSEGIRVLTPHLSQNTKNDEKNIIVNELLNRYLSEKSIDVYESWYLGTSAWAYSNELSPFSITLDIEEPNELQHPLASLSSIITSSLHLTNEDYIYLGDAIDIDHFLQARLNLIKPDELKDIPEPIIGCMGFQNNSIVFELARLRPDYHFIIFQNNELDYPTMSNVHFVGEKSTISLPLYLSSLKVALTAPNEEVIDQLLCAGKRIIQIGASQHSTPLVHECLKIDDVVSMLDEVISSPEIDPLWLSQADEYLQNKTFDQKIELIFKKKNDLRQDGFNSKIAPQII